MVSRRKIVNGCVVFFLAGGVVAWIYKISTHREVSYYPNPDVQYRTTTRPLFAEQEEQHELYLEARSAEQELAKLREKREASVECQFWRQQKKEGRLAIADKKIEQFCLVNSSSSQPAIPTNANGKI